MCNQAVAPRLVTVPGFWVSDNTGQLATPDTEGRSVIARPAEHDDFPVRVEKVRPLTYVAYRWTRVVESGFSRLTGSDELRRTAFAGNSEGWGQCFEALKNRAEQSTA